MLALTEPIDLRLTFERDASGEVQALTLVDRDGTRVRAVKSLPFREEPFEFQSGDVTIRGTLTLPPGEGPHPAAVWVHGSGQATRARAGVWPAFFASRGFAMLAVDKRGVGESEGTYELPNGGHDNVPHMRRRSGKVRAAVAALGAHDDIKARAVGLCGASQAGWVIPQACVGNEVAFAITLSGGATHLSIENVFSEMAQEMDADASSLPFDEFYRRTRNHRPRGPDFRPYFAAMSCPGLWLYGLKDRSNPSPLCIELIEEVASEHAKDFTVVSYPSVNHSLLVCNFGGAREAGALGTRAPGMFGTVAEWLAKQGFGPPVR